VDPSGDEQQGDLLDQDMVVCGEHDCQLCPTALRCQDSATLANLLRLSKA